MNTVHAAQAGQGGPVTIACINKATVDLGVPFDRLTVTLQKCYDEQFLPVWGYPVKLYNAKVAKPSDWQFVYFDDADTAGALGYHDLTKDGQPVSKIFVKTTLADNQLVSVTACHELSARTRSDELPTIGGISATTSSGSLERRIDRQPPSPAFHARLK